GEVPRRMTMVVSVKGVKLTDEVSGQDVAEHLIHHISQCVHLGSESMQSYVSYVHYDKGRREYTAHVFEYGRNAEPLHATLCRAFGEAHRLHREKQARLLPTVATRCDTAKRGRE